MTKKIDEAVSLNVSTQQGEMSSTTTFTAEDTAALAAMLKNAGIAGNSTAFNGPATLTVDVSEGGGTMNTTIQAPDLRSIMKLLEPEFEATGAMDSALDQAHADMDAMAADGHEVGVEIYDPGMSPYDAGTPKDACVDGACDAAPEVDMGMDLDEPEMAPVEEPAIMDDYEAGFADAKRHDGGLDEQALNENTEDDVFDILDYACDLVAAGATEGSEEFDLGDDLAELHFVAAPYAEDNYSADQSVIDGLMAKYGVEEPYESGIWNDDERGVSIHYIVQSFGEVDESTTMQEYPGVGSKEIVQPTTHAVPARSGDNPIDEGNNPYGEKTLDTYLRDGPVMVMYDHDSGDFDTGLDYPSVSSTGLTVTINSVVDEFDNELLDSLTPEERNTLEQECIDDLHSMEESAPAPKGFKDYFNEATQRNAPVVEAVSEAATMESLLAAFKLNELSNNVKNAYFKKAADDINNHANHAEKQRGIGNHDQAAKHDAKIMHRAVGMRNAIAKESEVDEASRGSDWGAKAKQFGPAFYLNTDCGYASLEDIGQHDYFQHGGVVVLAINRNGKWGLNYVAGHDTTAPGTKVTCVTQTSTGQKYREGKVVDSFTMDEYNNDRAGLEARLAKHGISPTKKLSVKTFD